MVGSTEGVALVPGDQLASHERDRPGSPARGRLARLGARHLAGPARHLAGPAGRWLPIFGVSLGLFIVRFLVPAPVGQADNRDGPRLMCGRGLGPVIPHGDPRYFRYAYFASVD